jgi:hypothetical protein
MGRGVRDPLLALGCPDPVTRIREIKERDPDAARAWRAKRGLEKGPQIAFLLSRIGAESDPWIQAQIDKLEGKP